MIDPSRIRQFTLGPATGTIGSLTDATVQGRFDFGTERLALLHAYVYFYGGTGTATLTLYKQRWAGKPATNFPRWTWTGKGGDAAATADRYAEVGLTEDEMYGFIFNPGEQAVFTWTDPSSAATVWTIDLVMYAL